MLTSARAQNIWLYILFTGPIEKQEKPNKETILSMINFSIAKNLSILFEYDKFTQGNH